VLTAGKVFCEKKEHKCKLFMFLSADHVKTNLQLQGATLFFVVRHVVIFIKKIKNNLTMLTSGTLLTDLYGRHVSFIGTREFVSFVFSP
jgi:hypothetical protein